MPTGKHETPVVLFNYVDARESRKGDYCHDIGVIINPCGQWS